MKKKNPAALMKRLVENEITREELEKLLEDMDDKEVIKQYEIYLRDHFDKIMKEYGLNGEKKENRQ